MEIVQASQEYLSRPFGTTQAAYDFPGLASWAKFSRPSGTFDEFFRGM
jgi:hypothetical protein